MRKISTAILLDAGEHRHNGVYRVSLGKMGFVRGEEVYCNIKEVGDGHQVLVEVSRERIPGMRPHRVDTMLRVSLPSPCRADRVARERPKHYRDGMVQSTLF